MKTFKLQLGITILFWCCGFSCVSPPRITQAQLAAIASATPMQSITLNPQDHPVNTRFLAKCGNENDKDCVAEYRIMEWAKTGYVLLVLGEATSPQGHWQHPKNVRVIEILPKR